MPAGLRVRNTFGVVVWDSTIVVRWIFADVREFEPLASGVIQYPSFIGATVDVVHDSVDPDGTGVEVSTPGGIPTVTVSPVAAGGGGRRFKVLLY